MGDREFCVCYFVEVLGQVQPKISRHLTYLLSDRIVDAPRKRKWMRHRIVIPENLSGGQMLRHTLVWINEDRAVPADRAQLAKACCRPTKFVPLQSAPAPISISSHNSNEAKQSCPTNSTHKYRIALRRSGDISHFLNASLHFGYSMRWPTGWSWSLRPKFFPVRHSSGLKFDEYCKARSNI